MADMMSVLQQLVSDDIRFEIYMKMIRNIEWHGLDAELYTNVDPEYDRAYYNIHPERMPAWIKSKMERYRQTLQTLLDLVQSGVNHETIESAIKKAIASHDQND